MANKRTTNTSLLVIILAALLLEMTMGVMYYAAQHIIEQNMQRVVERDMNAVYLGICNKLDRVEVTLDNMAWAMTDDLAKPDSILSTTRLLVENNPDFLGVGAMFIPDYYPKKGYWYEPYSIRKADGTIESRQLGSASHDYTKNPLFSEAIAKGCGFWCKPYMDFAGARDRVTTYMVPVRDRSGKIAAVLGADIPLDWLDELINADMFYQSSQRYLVTDSGQLLAGKSTPAFQSALELIAQDEDKTGYQVMTDEAGDKLHVFYHPVDEKTDWILISVCYDSEVFGELRSVRRRLLLLTIAGILLLGFIVFRAMHQFERLHQVNAEKERISGELHVASQIQQSMLPGSRLQRDDVDIMGSLVPAREVGGDLFDYFIRDEKLFFCIGDVSGKGAPSALLMAVVHALFRSASAHESNPARMMDTLNESSCRGNDSNMFVTLFIGVLDLPTGHLRYCDAGHDAPILIGNGELRRLDCNPHLPVGAFDDTHYGVQETQLEPDSILFLYTDGLTEAKDINRKQFGIERAETVLGTCKDLNPKEILERITSAVHAFVKGAEQSDDLTLLAIRYTPKNRESTLAGTLLIKNNVQEVKKLSTFMKSVMEKLNLEQSLARQLRLAVEEAVVNVIDYAYPAGQEGDIEVRILSDGEMLKAVIIDSGVAFDPTAIEKTDTSLPVEDRQMGGLGILLVRGLMDSINYERIKKQNILTLIKRIN